MAHELHPFRNWLVDVKVDEQMAEALGQTVGSGGSMDSGDLTQLVFVGIAILGVIVALAVVYGRINRRRGEYEDDDDGRDLFADQFGDDPDSFPRAEDFSSIRITREPDDEPSHGAREPGPLTSDAEDDDPFEDSRGYAREEEEAAVNVVPLRAPEQAAEPATMTRREEEPLQRERMTMAAAEPRGDYNYGAASSETGQRRDWGGYDDRTMTGRSYDDEDAPFVAPFIRDYIEDSERRQYQRLDDLRDDMRRQLANVRDEQSNRLDLFLSTIDRKLTQGYGGGKASDSEDGASTRRRIDALSGSIDQISHALERQGERLSELSRSMEQRLTEMSPLRGDLRSVHEDVLSFRRDVEANTLAIGQLRDDFDTLKEDFGRMERSFLERAQSDQGVTMRLADVVRGTLDDDEYELNAKLPNGHTADCVIYLRGGRSKVAIDARFPIESFNRLPSRDAVRRNMPQAKAGEDEFRRTVLRSIFSCADRCIVNGDTADSAIMFLPSEAAYTILHDRFPDLVRDSHRARVWLTSPSTLMGTLNLLHNVLPGEEEPLPHEAAEAGFEDEEIDGPFYAGPVEPPRVRSYEREDDFSRDDERAAEIERKLRFLREQEEALAEELVRTRESGAKPRRYQSEAPKREPRDEDDFETRLERFSFDLDQSRGNYDYDETPRRGFRDDRDDDLR